MHRMRHLATVGVAALAIAALLPAPALAAGPDRATDRIGLDRLDPTLRPLALHPDRTVTVMLELRGNPAVQRGGTRGGQRAAALELAGMQRGVAASVRAAGGSVVARYRYAYNGMRVRAAGDDLAAMAALPDVVAVHPVRTYALGNANGNAAIGASRAWADAGVTGDGVTVAVIDSGIDYTHADFGGAGTPAAYDANDPTIVEADSFPTARVIAGYDLAGDEYDAVSDDPARNTPAPDADPLDCNGHGTHVAGTIAGAGVNLDGSTYDGPYAGDTVGDGSAFAVAPGMAPGARLVAFKVFGCDGSTDLLVDALDRVAQYNATHADGIDVVNLSLGAPFGTPSDPDAVAVDNLVASGVVVVAAAGNEGSVPYVVGAPGLATGAITVAAYDATSQPDQGEVAAFSSAGPRWGDSALKPDVSAPGVSVVSAAAGTGSGAVALSGTSMATPMTAGAAALVIEAHPAWDPLHVKAALVNTADHAAVARGSPLRSGSGLVQADLAAGASVVATTSDGTASLSWGYRQLARAWSSSRTLTLTNDGPSTATYALTSSSSRVTPATASVTVPAHSSVDVKVTATLSKKAVKRLCSADLWVGEGCAALRSLSGAVTATPVSAGDGQRSLRVPFLIVPRGVSKIAATRSTSWSRRSGKVRGRLLFANTSVHHGYADVYALGPRDRSGDGSGGTDLRATGLQVLPSTFLWSLAHPADRSLVFAVNLHDRYSIASPHTYRVLVDVTGDRSADYIIESLDAGLVDGETYLGQPVALVWDVAAEEYVDAWSMDAPLNGSTLLLPTLASDIGLSGSGRLAYRVEAENGLTGEVDATGWSQSFSPWNMKQSQGQFKVVEGRDTARARAWFRRVSSVKGWLVVTLDDRNGEDQADIVKVPKRP